MEYKICEKCEAKLHVRTLRCPNCNTLLTDASKIVINEPSDSENFQTTQNTIGNEIDVKISNDDTITQQPTQSPIVEQNNEVRDYVYKAEVRHSLEYTAPLSNFIKVILTAFSMIPIIGQFIGTFFGIFFATYDDNDRHSFGKALICLSVVMFLFYSYNLIEVSEILSNGELSNYLNNFIK